MEAAGMIILAYFLLNLLDSRLKKIYVYGIYFLFAVADRIALIPVWNNGIIRATVSMGVMLLVTVFVFKDKLTKKIIAFLLFAFCDLIAEILTILTIVNVFNFDVNASEYFTLHRIIGSALWFLLSSVIAATVARFIRRHKITIDEKAQYYVIACVAVQCINTMTSLSIVGADDPKVSKMLVTMTVSVTNIIIFGILIYLNMRNNAHAYRNHEFLLQEASLRDRHYEELKKQYESFRRIRHDFNAHINALDVLQAKGETREVTKYIARMKEEFAAAGTVKYSNIPILDAILFAEKEEADERGIETEFKTAEFVENPLSDYELCSLVSNMLSKAMKSAQEYAGKKFISLECFENDGYLVIKVQNSTDPPQKEEHDIGEEIIRSTAEKNGGNVSEEYSGNIFRTTVKLRTAQ